MRQAFPTNETALAASDRRAGDFLLRRHHRSDELVAVSQRRREHETLMDGLAEIRGQSEMLGEMRVVAKILAGEIEPEFQTVISAGKRRRREHLEDAAIGATGRNDFAERVEIETGF